MFNGSEVEDILKNNKECDLRYVPYYTQHLSTQCQDILNKMLEKNQAKRPSAAEALKHLWFHED